jgi:hypothetical protein
MLHIKPFVIRLWFQRLAVGMGVESGSRGVNFLGRAKLKSMHGCGDKV